MQQPRGALVRAAGQALQAQKAVLLLCSIQEGLEAHSMIRT